MAAATTPDLPLEVLTIIFKHANLPRSTLGYLVRSSKTLYTAIVPLLYAELTIAPVQLRSPLYDAAPGLLRVAGIKGVSTSGATSGAPSKRSALARHRLPAPQAKPSSQTTGGQTPPSLIPRDIASFDPRSTRKAHALAHVHTLTVQSAFDPSGPWVGTALPDFPSLHTLRLDMRTGVCRQTEKITSKELAFLATLRPRRLVIYRMSVWDMMDVLGVLPQEMVEQVNHIVVVLDLQSRVPGWSVMASATHLQNGFGLATFVASLGMILGIPEYRNKVENGETSETGLANPPALSMSTNTSSSTPLEVSQSDHDQSSNVNNVNNVNHAETSTHLLIRPRQIDIVFYSSSPMIPFGAGFQHLARHSSSQPFRCVLGTLGLLIAPLEKAGMNFRFVGRPASHTSPVDHNGRPNPNYGENMAIGKADAKPPWKDIATRECMSITEYLVVDDWRVLKKFGKLYPEDYDYDASEGKEFVGKGEGVFPEEDVIKWRQVVEDCRLRQSEELGGDDEEEEEEEGGGEEGEGEEAAGQGDAGEEAQ